MRRYFLGTLLGFAFSVGLLQAEPLNFSGRIQLLESNLHSNIAPFWFSKSIDVTNGGYHIGFDLESKPQSNPPKMIVTQSRLVWFFSRLARAGYKEKESLAAAEHGFKFLTTRMLDQKNGGYFWEVDYSGTNVTAADKHLYGQSFALYALSEYAVASGNPEARKAAEALFKVLEEKSHDTDFGGYREYFRRDWNESRAESTYLGDPVGIKIMNTHLHLMEALTSYVRLTWDEQARKRLVELIFIQSNAVSRKRLGACTDKYERDWTPILTEKSSRVSYGHDIENIWLLIDACEVAKIPQAVLADFYRSTWDYSLKNGYDPKDGGFYDSGGFDQPADYRQKVWWVQAEALVAAIYLHELTDDPKYLAVFDQTLKWVHEKQTDWVHGEWFWEITPEGKASGDKGNAWKAAYHQGRAMIECLEVCRRLKSYEK